MKLFWKKITKLKLKKGIKLLLLSLILIWGLSLISDFTDSIYAANDLLPGQNSEGFVKPDATQVASNIDTTSTLRDLVMKIVNYFLTFLGLVAVVGVVYSGGLMVTSMGNDDQYEKGKKGLGYMVIGIIVVLMSYTIVNWVIKAGGEMTGGAGTTVDGGTGGGNNTGSSSGDTNYYTDNYYNDNITNENPINLNSLNALVDTLEALRQGLINDTGASSPELDEVLALLNTYLRTPTAANWDNFINAYNNLINQFSSLPILDPNQGLNLDWIRNQLNNLKSELNGFDSSYSNDLDEIMRLLDIYLNNPTNQNWNNYVNAYKDFFKKFNNIPVMKAIININPPEGNVPLKVRIDGLKSSDPMGKTIPNSNYEWTYVNIDGQSVSLPSQATIEEEFIEPGSYVINLKITSDSTTSDNKKAVLDWHASYKVTVSPALTKINLKINDNYVEGFYKTTFTEAQQGLTFDISESFAEPGRNFDRFFWIFGDGDNLERFDTSPLVHAYAEAKEYAVSIRATDSHDKVYIKQIKLVINYVLADFTVTPKNGNIGDKFTFTAEKAKPNADNLVQYLWEIRDKNEEVLIESDQRNFDYKFLEPGTYQITLTVRDNTGNTDTIVQDFTVESRNPKAVFNWDIADNTHPSTVTFNTEQSYDIDEEDITFDWDFNGDGTYEEEGLTDLVFTHRFDKVGKYKTKLRVNDPYGNTDIEQKIIEITSTLDVDFTPSSYTANQDDELFFTAQSKNVESYYWDFGDGNIFQTDKANIKHSFSKPGIYNVTLQVFDSENNMNKITKKIYIAPNWKPMAVAEIMINGQKKTTIEDLCGNNQSGLEFNRGDRLTFIGEQSINAFGESKELEYTWDFGDGVYSNQNNITHTYNELSVSGKCFQINLGVKDLKTGASAKSEFIYVKIVNAIPYLSYLEVIPPDDLITPAQFKLSARWVEDVDGKVVKYRWWYYKEGDTEPREIQTTAVPTSMITVLGDGLAGQENDYYFVVELVDDNNGIINSSELFNSDVPYTIENGKNSSPIVEFSVDKTVIYMGDSINFYAKASNPQGDDIPDSAYKWDFDGDGTFDDVSSGPQISRRYNVPGEFEVRLKVDLKGLSTSKTKTIYVKRLTDFPEAAFVYEINNKTVKFDARNTRFDKTLDDTSLKYSWDFDTSLDFNGNGINTDDHESDTIIAEHTFKEDGIYFVRLTVTDTLGSEDFVERKIVINSISETDSNTSSNKLQTSLTLSSNLNLMTTLDLSMPDQEVSIDDLIDITARIIQANWELYAQKVHYNLLEGSGEFIPSQVEAHNGIAVSSFKPSAAGLVTVEVIVPTILGGPLKEQISFNVK